MKLNARKTLKTVEFAIFILPAVVLVFIASNLPFLMNIYYSFQKWNGLSKKIEFIGLQNFIELFTKDPTFWNAFGFTFKYLVFYAVLANIFALAFAIMLTGNFYARNFIRSSIYLPNIISLIAVSLIWRFIYGPGFKAMYDLTGVEIFNLSWLGDSKLAFYSLLITTLWQTVGFNMIIYIAGLTSVSTDVIEASTIDGCVGFNMLVKIKLPLIIPSITVCVFNSITYALKLFDIILVMTKGGPGESTSTVAYNIYTEAFLNGRYGYGTAKALVFFMVVFFITAIQVGFFKGKEVEA